MLSNKRLQTILLAALIILFWFPICFNNEFFYDDWTFIDVFKAGPPALSYFLKPSNEHFMPLFKGIFFLMFKLFRLNIIPYMGLSILMHILNCVLFLILLRLIFPKNPLLPFWLSLFFALNTTYFEILHWFTNFSQALTFFFLLITLILLHRSFLEGKRMLFWASVLTSFFIPMNFSMGFLGIVFIALYYILILSQNTGRRLFSSLWPYFLSWFVYLIIYLIFTLPSILHKPATAPAVTFKAGQVFLYTLLGFTGLLVKNLGFSLQVFPYSTILAIILAVLVFFFTFFLILYLILNPQKERTTLFGNWKIAAFSLMNMILCYVVLALGRASLGAEAFLSWGRYHYLPMFFLTLLMGTFLFKFIEIFSRIFKQRRFILFLAILFILFLTMHFMLIRQKSESSIRTEGAVPAHDVSADRNTSADIWAARPTI